MQVTLIKTDDGYLIPYKEILDELNQDTINVNINIEDNTIYKELKDSLLLNRYNQGIVENKDITKVQKEFRLKHNINSSLEEFLKGIK